MNKLFTKVVGVALGLTMAVGVGVAVGASKVEAVPVHAASQNFDFSTGTFSNNTITWSDSQITIFQEKVSGSTNPSSSYVSNPRWYGGNMVTFTPASGVVIDDMTITCGSNAYATTLNDGTWTNASHSVSNAVVTVTPTDGTSAFTVTLSGQSRISSLSYNYSAQSSATLTSIALSGSMTKTSYTTAEEWDPTGLVVTGTYSDSTTKNLTAGSTFTYYNSSNAEVARPKDLGVGSGQTLKVVASYTGVSDTAKYTASTSIEVTKAIEYELVTDPSDLTKGTTFMLVATGTYNSTTYTRAMVSADSGASSVATVTLSDSFNSGSVATSASATIFTLDGSVGAWKIKDGNKQLGFTGSSNNNMSCTTSQTDTFKITIQSGYTLSIESNGYSGRKLQYNVNNGSPRFSNYNGGQTYVYMFAMIAEVSYGTTDHIEIATKPETEFAVGDTFNTTGMVVNAWDSADDSGNSKPVTTFATSISGSPSTPFEDDDIGSHTVTVSYTESGDTFTDTYDIYVYAAATYELVEDEPANWSGNYLITYTVSTATEAIPETGTYAMRASLNNFDVVGNFSQVTPVTESGTTTITAGQHLQWSFAAYSTGYSIQGHSGKYIGWNSSSNNGLTTSNSALVNTLSISGSDATILCSAGTKGLTLSTSSGQFRYYSNATVQLYKLVESSDVSDYADMFSETLSTGANAVCDAGGDTNLGDLKSAWKDLADLFDMLSNADKQQFTQGTADESGDNVGQALALYDFIAAKYNDNLEGEGFVSDYDFMQRGITPMSNARILDTVIGQNGSMTAIIVIISMVSLTSIGGYFFLKRRKEN